MKATTDIALILKAAAFAAHKHRDQRRKDAGATPYINHPLALASLLADEAGITDPTVLAAALLHDTIEDTETTAAASEVSLSAWDDATKPSVELCPAFGGTSK